MPRSFQTADAGRGRRENRPPPSGPYPDRLRSECDPNAMIPEFPLPSPVLGLAFPPRTHAGPAPRHSRTAQGKLSCRTCPAWAVDGAACMTNARIPCAGTAICPAVPSSSGATKKGATCVGPCSRPNPATRSAATSIPAGGAAHPSTPGGRTSETGTHDAHPLDGP